MDERIKRIRKEFKMTQDKFSKKVGISVSAVSKIEKGINNPSEQTIRAICREFGISRYWLETGEGAMYEIGKKITPGEIRCSLYGNYTEEQIALVMAILEASPETIELFDAVSLLFDAAAAYIEHTPDQKQTTTC